MLVPGQQHCPIFSEPSVGYSGNLLGRLRLVPCQKIEHRLGLVFPLRQAVQKSVEQLRNGLGSRRGQNKDALRKLVIMKEFRILNRSEVGQCFCRFSCFFFVKEPVNVIFQWHKASRACLEMEMIRCRGTAFRSVIENGE